MDQLHSDSDVSMSPTKILERLQVLRQLQLLQRGKLQKQRLEYHSSPETTSSITEIVSQFSNSTSYNAFRSSLQSSHQSSNEGTPHTNTSILSQKVNEQDLIEGVSVLNLSQESELIIGSPISTKSHVSSLSKRDMNVISPLNNSAETKILARKQIALEEMPILSPKKDFETLILEKLKNETNTPMAKNSKKKPEIIVQSKKPFLRRGEGMARFGLQKNDLVIQNTKSLPWKRKKLQIQPPASSIKSKKQKKNNKVQVQILVNEKKPAATKKNVQMKINTLKETSPKQDENNESTVQTIEPHNCELHTVNQLSEKLNKLPIKKHPLLVNKGKTWAAILTKEQDHFLQELKQSDYYKNFTSPAKSTISDVSCDEQLLRLNQERESAEQNMFELLENKVSQEDFNLENSFFNRFLRSKLEVSGESTPLIMQKCLAENPDLMHIFPVMKQKQRSENSHSDVESRENTECCSDTCSSVCSQCSCQTVEEANNSPQKCITDGNHKKNDTGHKSDMNKAKKKENEKCQDDTITEDNIMKANMVEMNAKLIATSDLLKERLHELEDEIEIFRKENANLTKLREEIDLERLKFYDEKTVFEQKFNEEKILSEYYLAEEKEKLMKQKQMYDKYVREMRGRLNKKDKDEVQKLKKEINDLKEEIRLKDAKSTSTIARLRNQIKIIEKDKQDSQEEIEKLKKQNRRILHSNDVTRRLTNIKYLQEINKKLSHISSKATQSEISVDSDVKYKAFEIERQSRSRNFPMTKNVPRPRAKSVPNLNVTSRYAKYFSQRDAQSQMERNKTIHNEYLGTYPSDNDDVKDDKYDNITLNCDTHSTEDDDMSDNEENNLEKIYMERFASSPQSSRCSLPNNNTGHNMSERNHCINPQGFFISKSSDSSSTKNSISPNQRSISPLPNCSGSNTFRSKSPVSILSNRSTYKSSTAEKDSKEYLSGLFSRDSNNSKRSKSPSSVISNPSLSSQRSATVINMDNRMIVSPEPSSSKTSLTKTNLNPTEIKKSDGSKELRFPNGNIKHISADGKYSKFIYYNGDVKETFYNEGRIKYFYAETKTFHTTHADGLEVLEFPDGQVEKRYKDGSTEIRLPNGSIRYFDPKNEHVQEEWHFPDGIALTVSANGERRIVFSNGQVEVHAQDHKRREFPDGTVKLVYNDGTAETRYVSGRVRIKDKHGNLVMDSAPG